MGFFSNLFNKPNSSNEFDKLPPCTSEQELLDRYAAIVFEKQLDFGEIIGEKSRWGVDMTKGTISFDSAYTLPLQAIGSLSHSAQSWLWSWANTKSGLTAEVTKYALQLKKYGEDNGIDLLRNDSFDFSSEEMHVMGTVAVGILNASAYYIADYGQGALLVVIDSPEIDKHRKNIFPQVISRWEVDHREALRYYLMAKGYEVKQDGNTLVGSLQQNTITAIFDESGRLENLKA